MAVQICKCPWFMTFVERSLLQYTPRMKIRNLLKSVCCEYKCMHTVQKGFFSSMV